MLRHDHLSSTPNGERPSTSQRGAARFHSCGLLGVQVKDLVECRDLQRPDNHAVIVDHEFPSPKRRRIDSSSKNDHQGSFTSVGTQWLAGTPPGDVSAQVSRCPALWQVMSRRAAL